MRRLGALLVRRAPADDGLAADDGRLILAILRLLDRGGNRIGIVPVDVLHHVPAVGFEALRRVFGEPAGGLAVDGDAVVVVEHDELAELQVAGERGRFVRDAFHEAAVADEAVGVVIDDRRAVLVVLRREQFLGERHAHRVGETLAERTGGRFDADLEIALRVSRGARAQLAEFLQLIDGERIAREMQQGVQQHRAVAVRKHEAVAVPPFRVAGIVLEHIAPQHLGNVGHAHGRAGMSRIRGLNGIHGERANGVGQGAAGGGHGWGIHKGRALSDRQAGGGNQKCGKAAREEHCPGGHLTSGVLPDHAGRNIRCRRLAVQGPTAFRGGGPERQDGRERPGRALRPSLAPLRPARRALSTCPTAAAPTRG